MIFIPFGRTVSLSIFPSGDGSDATLRMSAAMPAMRSRFSSRRSYIGSDGSIRARSSRLASRISSVCFSAASASAVSVRSIFDAETQFNSRDASSAFSKQSFSCMAFCIVC